MTDGLTIRPVAPGDARAIIAIYNHYVANTVVTFEESPVTGDDIAARIAAVTAVYPWLVAEKDGAVIGYSYAGKYHARAAYLHTVETTIYLDHRCHGRGLGTALFRSLLDRLPGQGIHAAIGSISLPNPASIALHEKMGFAPVGRFPQIGFKFGQWIDVVYLHRIFGAP